MITLCGLIPDNTEHMSIAGDRGIYETYYRGQTCRPVPKLPIAQFIELLQTTRTFYNVRGALRYNPYVAALLIVLLHHAIASSTRPL